MYRSNRSCKLILLTVFAGLSIVSAKFPENPTPCKYADSDCLKKVIEIFMEEKKDGDSTMNFPKLNPLAVKSIHIKQGEESPIAIDLIFKNGNVYGVDKAELLNVKGFGKNPEGKKHVITARMTINMISDYVINGKVLILPIAGAGKSNFTLVNTKIVLTLNSAMFEKDGAKYFKSVHTKVAIIPERVTYHFGNLFNGDKALGDNMNLFLNDNWEEIYQELKDSIETEIAKVFDLLINNFFSHTPYENLFSKE